jgi:hypothetical protein
MFQAQNQAQAGAVLAGEWMRPGFAGASARQAAQAMSPEVYGKLAGSLSTGRHSALIDVAQ